MRPLVPPTGLYPASRPAILKLRGGSVGWACPHLGGASLGGRGDVLHDGVALYQVFHVLKEKGILLGVIKGLCTLHVDFDAHLVIPCFFGYFKLEVAAA